MFEVDFSTTKRSALIDVDRASRLAFARASIAAAKVDGASEVIWHFAAKDSVRHLDQDPDLRQLASRLFKHGEAIVGGVRIVLVTKRSRSTAGDFGSPLAAWWTSDLQLLELDTTERSSLLAFLSNPSRAPIWLTTFEIDVGQPVGVQDRPGSIVASDPQPIVVTAELQEVVRQHSGSMTLSSNGIHDSLGGEFLAAVRPFVRRGHATPEAVAVAALRAGWWPKHVPDLMSKL